MPRPLCLVSQAGLIDADAACARADLFSWIKGTRITSEQAMRTAKREPGRSWEAIHKELHRLGALNLWFDLALLCSA